jgi:hypothetical protein
MRVHREAHPQGIEIRDIILRSALGWGKCNGITFFRVRMTAWRYELRICGEDVCVEERA